MRTYEAVQTITCEWCGKRCEEAQAYEYADDINLHLCFCSEACLTYAPSLALAIRIAAAPFSQYVYRGASRQKGHR